MAASEGRRRPDAIGALGAGFATALVIGLLVTMLVIVAMNAFGWFWPARLWRFEMVGGESHVGEIVEQESPLNADSPGGRLRLKVGNRGLGGEDFLWIDAADVLSRSKPPDLVRVVRTEYGDAFGAITEVVAPEGVRIEAPTRQQLDEVVEAVGELKDERDDLHRRLIDLRLPLTKLLEKRSTLSRSPDRDSNATGRAIRILDQQIERTRFELRAEIVDLDAQIALRTEQIDRSILRLQTTDGERSIELGDIVRIQWSNRMNFLQRCGWAIRQGVFFLVSDPREANTEGGIFPALFGTILLVLLMTIVVVPLGVITALYMTEYARQGFWLRLARLAINNLAGVPSIVFGMFGLAFFVYWLGGHVDQVAFADRLPSPTFGTGGLLWAALTLALLTVPVVVVATREALLAVPQDWREGARALGATRWQTVRQVILPAATPGILTGVILAVGRAAGEVAPLMLTGAVKLAPTLPVDGTAPYIHLQRKFMHLGFHIYDVSMQSPNVEAAKPMAFAATLVLLGLVLILNLTAIELRRRLLRKYRRLSI